MWPIHLCQVLPPPTSSSSAQGSLAVFGRPGVKSELWPVGHAGHAHLGTWPSCLGGTCGTRCCSWCRCGEDTSRPTGRRSGTGDTEKSTYAGARGGVRRHLWQSAEPNAGADGPSPAGVTSPSREANPHESVRKHFICSLAPPPPPSRHLCPAPSTHRNPETRVAPSPSKATAEMSSPARPGPEGPTAPLREPTSRCVREPRSCSFTSHAGL